MRLLSALSPSLFRTRAGRVLSLGLLVAAALLSAASPCRADCGDESLLFGRRPEGAEPQAAARLVDGVITPEGQRFDAPEAVRFTAPLLWDLGREQTVRAVFLQADARDEYIVSVSLDGEAWNVFWEAPLGSEHGLASRSSIRAEARARFVKLEARQGDGVYAAAELALYCRQPAAWPPVFRVGASLGPLTEERLFARRLESSLFVLGCLASAGLLFALSCRSRRVARWITSLALLAGLLAWPKFGHLHGPAVGPVHKWDMYHYWIGTKYFRELHYDQLYVCVAAAERESGRGAQLDAHKIRDLRTNELHPGAWARSAAGACEASFSPSRWAAFRRDVAAFQERFVAPPFIQSFQDHGFNGSPWHAAWLSSVVQFAPITEGWMVALAQLDSLALLATVAALYWGFGLWGAAFGAVVLGFGPLWGYSWVGGGLARHVWLALAAGGLAAARRGHLGWAGALAVASGFLRLFPLVFAGALGIYALGAWWRTRSSRDAASSSARSEARVLFAALSLAVLFGVAAVLVRFGADAILDFIQNSRKHALAPASNRLGLDVLLGHSYDLPLSTFFDDRLTDPAERWREIFVRHVQERAPIRWFFAGLGLTTLIVGARLRARPEVLVGLSGPLVFGLTSMTSYDYEWLVLLVPLTLPLGDGVVAQRRAFWRAASLLSFVLFTSLGNALEVELGGFHLVASGLLLILLVAIVRTTLLDLRDAASTPTPLDERSLSPRGQTSGSSGV